ncbi:hypothetical protein G6F22_015198 [Rhizopus arrhizus]|nr:hypothetical protein G6F22_015198 [Rhizopus arrhizus]
MGAVVDSHRIAAAGGQFGDGGADAPAAAGSDPHVVRGAAHAALVAGVHDPTGFHQHQVSLFLRAGLVFDTLGDDRHVARAQVDVAVAQFDPQPAADDDERLVGVRMAVPDKIALHLDHLELVFRVGPGTAGLAVQHPPPAVWRHAVGLHMAMRQVALVGEAGAGRGVRQRLAGGDQPAGEIQAAQHHVAIGAGAE